MATAAPSSTGSNLRRRNTPRYSTNSNNAKQGGLNQTQTREKEKMEWTNDESLESISTYWLTALLILRSMAFVYFVAFAVAYFQNNALIGINGIHPYTKVLDKYDYLHSNYDKFMEAPSLLWFLPRSDTSLQSIALIGMILSALVVIFGHWFCHIILFFALWILYHSLASYGPELFYGYGWESQVLETGFLCLFLCRFRICPWSLDSDKSFTQIPDIPPSSIIRYCFLWLIFRIMLGSGLIKVRAGQCWLDFTCMDYHYETQPNPNPISWILHNNPHWFHQFEVGVNHFVELFAIWFLFVPIRSVRICAAIIQILFQFVIIISGNLSFLNWLTIVPSLAALDDAFCNKYLWLLFTPWERSYLFDECAKYYIQYTYYQAALSGSSSYFYMFYVYSFGNVLYTSMCIMVAILIVFLSRPVVTNLLSQRQIMNTSFDNFKIVNTHGAFGTVGKERFEVVFKMIDSGQDMDDESLWTEVVFKCKPGPLGRRPCLITPYHYRLDWQIWFAGFRPHSPYQHPWVFIFVAQLLTKDANTIKLLDDSMNAYMRKHDVKFIKADMYKYQFTKHWSDKDWWTREKTSEYLPPLSMDNLQFRNVLRQLEWQGFDKKAQRKPNSDSSETTRSKKKKK